ncbi:alkanesulfonate monooxygenase [Streptomyces sp. WZ.A104]|uniref:LLM class flavin-dependent oxidoreductase n=1 Tax=Streptomyces sp. WZ.A104 TaxID=2023771 RepID=UPI000BBC57B4|nr:LLM class flavin-dependent oxidoreductase [Streptomyces sp. WZ.A104]PCG85831.1 alkanesulfonate monooxygenase [Streptomyces sp. WZ.A104]
MSGVRAPDIDYLDQIAEAAEQLGLAAVLTPAGTWCEDAWPTTVALAQHTERLKFLVAFRPGAISPVPPTHTDGRHLSADHPGAAAAQRGDRGGSTEQRRFGGRLDHDRRCARTTEFLSVVRGAWSGQPYDFDGEHHRVEGGLTTLPPDPLPEIFFGGSSAAAGPVTAAHADVHPTCREPPAAAKKTIAWIRGLAEEQRCAAAHRFAGLLARHGVGHHRPARPSRREGGCCRPFPRRHCSAGPVATPRGGSGQGGAAGRRRALSSAAMRGRRASRGCWSGAREDPGHPAS